MLVGKWPDQSVQIKVVLLDADKIENILKEKHLRSFKLYLAGWSGPSRALLWLEFDFPAPVSDDLQPPAIPAPDFTVKWILGIRWISSLGNFH